MSPETGQGWACAQDGGGVQGCGLAWVWLISVFVVRMESCGPCRVYASTSRVWPPWASVVRSGVVQTLTSGLGVRGMVQAGIRSTDLGRNPGSPRLVGEQTDSYISLGLRVFICKGGLFCLTGFLRIKWRIVGASSIFYCYLSLQLSGVDRVQVENVGRDLVRVLCVLSKEMGKFLSLARRTQ